MKASKIFIFALALTFVLANTSCNRGTDDPDTIDAKELRHATDTDRIKAESDQVTGDADGIMSESSLGRTVGTTTTLCGATVDSSQIAQKILTVTYDNSTSCGGYVRSGSITLKLVAGTRWRDQNAVLEVTHNNYKVIRQSDNKSITFNGVKRITNVQPFNFQTLSKELKERGNNLSITFDDGTQRTWSLARRWIFTFVSVNPAVVNCSITGDSTLNGVTNTMVWGTNRDGVMFKNSTPIPILTTIGGACSPRNPSAGKWVHNLDGKGTLTATLGVDANGNAVSSGCAYGYKLEWLGVNGGTASVVKAYQ
ncbi:MAG: hypothetical protein ACKVTZ_02595 [Bacteroidia bacterium]